VYFALYTEILGPHDDLGSVSSAAVSTAGTVCDGSAGNFPNTGPVVRISHSSSAEGPVISSPFPKDNVSTYVINNCSLTFQPVKPQPSFAPSQVSCFYRWSLIW